MSRIREKATESEAIVRNITKDIQVLDLAKKNLILSMTTLKRMQMLGALSGALSLPQFLLSNGKSLQSMHFHSLTTISRTRSTMKLRRVLPYVVALNVALVWRGFGLTYVV